MGEKPLMVISFGLELVRNIDHYPIQVVKPKGNKDNDTFVCKKFSFVQLLYKTLKDNPQEFTNKLHYLNV